MRVRIVALLLIVAAGSVWAADSYTVAVLRGPTAVAFAPLMTEEVVLPDGRVLEFEVTPSPDVLVARLISGEVDAATLPSNLAARLFNRGIELQVAATFIWGVLYMLGPPGTELEDLAGGEVYSIGRGATPDLVLRYVLEQRDIDPVTIRYGLGQVELSQLLIAGRVGVAVLPEPFVTRVLGETDERVVVADMQALWREITGEAMPQTVLVTLGSQSDLMRTELTGLLRESVDGLQDNPHESLQNIGDLGLGLDAQTAIAALPRLNLRVESGVQSRSALVRYLGVLQAFDPASIGGEVPAESFFGVR